ncbi:hypothetical protein Lgra_2848 [Legionella gratiana]|uniref:Uncharacterized protein n=1 Tax=Legionella gratiana TaxID=45066 RepID=A0A378J723_9GAMM|nr:hypothetical protein [Legionella gratiana]KTD06071.1 hypothetical protein Lgra_2848 [Legionella gratiana]STX42781.1 Uncharacterised protein [Legionella gratiana]
MSTKLFQDKRIIANHIAQNFITVEEEAKSFCKKLEVLQEELYSVKTKTDFDNVVKKLITQGKETHQFLSTRTMGEGQEASALMYNSKYIGTLSKYVRTGGVLEEKESIFLEKALRNLTDVQKNEARNFINHLNELQPVSEILMSQEDKFKDRLSQTDSLDEVEAIEAEVLEKNNILEGSLNRLVSYPQDEAVAEALVTFLQMNERFLNIMQSFDIYASLEEDLTNARAAVMINNRSLRGS